MAHQNLGFDYDPDEVTQTDGQTLNGDPFMNQGKLMAAVVRLDKQMREGFGQVQDLNSRLGRIEKLLYGAAGTAALGVVQFVWQLINNHGR